MAFAKTATVLGCPVQYKLNPSAKRYTLRDNGFTETNGGNYQLLVPITATPQSQEGFKLKITVDKEVQLLKMSIVSKNGLQSIDIFKGDQHQMLQEKFYFLLDGMIDRGLFEKVA
ncbi:DUF1831 domain-containing protein [Enterococcus timonensis]|uniref:DUF1831 domain-containing protein n=1 Tax=Enterococcus timonensis TaxID=1852364 RepID=UPI0008D91B87|nr:DUF1831 domain-containing protein [Enterococcus timonensis]